MSHLQRILRKRDGFLGATRIEPYSDGRDFNDSVC
jgi:hypothetical protein